MRRARVLGVLAVLAVLLATGGPASAQAWRDLGGAAILHYELSEAHALDTPGAAPKDLVLAGVRLHGALGKDTLAYHVGLDLAAGATLRGSGFAYDVALFPIGVAARLSDTSLVALGAGVGAMGAVGTLDDAATFPIEVIAELGGGRVRVLARARTAFVSGAAGRASGAPHAPFGDELDATLGVRVGRHDDEHGIRSGNGYFVGATYRELEGTRFAGFVIGYAIDLATPRHSGVPTY